MTRESSPLETALDVLVYMPVGLAVTVTEELPKLAAKGRSRFGGQISAARMIGRLAVGQGRKLVTDAVGGSPPPAPRPPNAGRSTPATWSEAARSGPTVPPPVRPPAPAGAGVVGPDVDSLAIPGYDSLSASQVVQRLAGLTTEELEAVRRYEISGRGRRTVLSRVGQLQSG